MPALFQLLLKRHEEGFSHVAGDIDFPHAHADRLRHFAVLIARPAAQHQREGDRLANLPQTGDIQFRLLAVRVEPMRGANRDRQCIRAGFTHENRRLLGVGIQDLVTAPFRAARHHTDSAQLGFHGDIQRMGNVDYLAREGDIPLERLRGGVDHDRGKTGVNRFHHLLQRTAVIQMDNHRYARLDG